MFCRLKEVLAQCPSRYCDYHLAWMFQLRQMSKFKSRILSPYCQYQKIRIFYSSWLSLKELAKIIISKVKAAGCSDFYLFIYLFMAVLGPSSCARTFSSCSKWGPLFIAVRGPLTIAASPVAEHRLQTRRLSNCGTWAQLLRGMWDPPRPGLEPVSPALAGRPSTTAPPGKPLLWFLYSLYVRVGSIAKIC